MNSIVSSKQKQLNQLVRCLNFERLNEYDSVTTQSSGKSAQLVCKSLNYTPTKLYQHLFSNTADMDFTHSFCLKNRLKNLIISFVEY